MNKSVTRHKDWFWAEKTGTRRARAESQLAAKSHRARVVPFIPFPVTTTFSSSGVWRGAEMFSLDGRFLPISSA